jgi:hypothetical protein
VVTTQDRDALIAPFDVGELKFFCVATTKDKTKGKVGSYIDARAVMDRLDAVVGSDSWSTAYRILDPATKAVECQLTVDGVTKADVGYPNEAKDADNADKEPLKAAYSDALKRAAVQFGIGRYIYSLELEKDWLPIDQFGKFLEQPRLKGAPRQTAPRPAPTESPLADALRASVEAIKAEKGATFPGVSMVNGDGTLNFNEFWASCRRHNISREAVAKECGGDLNNLKTMSASAAVDVFNLLRDKQKETVPA